MPHFQVMEGLPKPLERALRSSVFEYSRARREFLEPLKGQYDVEFSVTDLYKSPKQLWLTRKFRDDIVINLVKDNFLSLLGNIVHYILEHHAPPHCIVEERQYVILNVGGVRVLFHGCPDLYDPETQSLDDYKFTSGYAVLYEKAEYEFQLNANAFLLESRGLEVRRIRNVYMFRYLDPIAQQRNPEYPKENVYLKHFKQWDRSVTEAKIRERIALHLKYRATMWKKLPDCSDEDRWIRNTTFAVYKRKNGTKKAPIQDWSSKSIARCETQEEAEDFIKRNKDDIPQEMKWIKKPGEPKRCQEFCPVAGWCDQYQNELKQNEGSIIED